MAAAAAPCQHGTETTPLPLWRRMLQQCWYAAPATMFCSSRHCPAKKVLTYWVCLFVCDIARLVQEGPQLLAMLAIANSSRTGSAEHCTTRCVTRSRERCSVMLFFLFWYLSGAAVSLERVWMIFWLSVCCLARGFWPCYPNPVVRALAGNKTSSLYA